MQNQERTIGKLRLHARRGVVTMVHGSTGGRTLRLKDASGQTFEAFVGGAVNMLIAPDDDVTLVFVTRPSNGGLQPAAEVWGVKNHTSGGSGLLGNDYGFGELAGHSGRKMLTLFAAAPSPILLVAGWLILQNAGLNLWSIGLLGVGAYGIAQVFLVDGVTKRKVKAIQAAMFELMA